MKTSCYIATLLVLFSTTALSQDSALKNAQTSVDQDKAKIQKIEDHPMPISKYCSFLGKTIYPRGCNQAEMQAQSLQTAKEYLASDERALDREKKDAAEAEAYKKQYNTQRAAQKKLGANPPPMTFRIKCVFKAPHWCLAPESDYGGAFEHVALSIYNCSETKVIRPMVSHDMFIYIDTQITNGKYTAKPLGANGQIISENGSCLFKSKLHTRVYSFDEILLTPQEYAFGYCNMMGQVIGMDFNYGKAEASTASLLHNLINGQEKLGMTVTCSHNKEYERP